MIRPDPKPPKPVRLKGVAKVKFRWTVAERANFLCADCGEYAGLNVGTQFDVLKHGHVAHIKSYGAGGGDTMDNVKWKCHHCHIVKEHGPQWSVKENK